MANVAGLALPFFGLIFLGYAAGRIWRRAESELGWLNIFVLYFALPALFFQLISRTPIEELANWRFVLVTTFASYTAFALAFAFAAFRTGGNIAEATIQGLVGGYGNVGYMGPPLALVAIGPQAAVPVALIFCFDVALAFTLAPLMMALGGASGEALGRTLVTIARRVLLHPFIVATFIGVAAAAIEFRPPAPVDRLLTILQGAAAPCALFALGVTVSMQPLKRMGAELPLLVAVKLLVHPLIVYLLLTWIGGFDPVWIYAAVLMASLPPAATIYVLATQYNTYVFRASSAILIGTVASVATVTAVLYLVTEGLLPLDPFGSLPAVP
ncbi:MAG TPA: AEC family transporter [Afifellaceae bacterium]|nr:AEC family transporter [Afifellaceae bacterium]